jgi:hypothetical protein
VADGAQATADPRPPGAARRAGAGRSFAGLQRRLSTLTREERITFGALALMTLGAIAVRASFVLSYRPAFLGFGDSYEYLLSAARNIFRDPQRPAGYPFFLRLLHHVSDHLLSVVIVQHALGVAAGLLLFAAVRRAGAPVWLGLLPAAVAFFGGTGVVLEHSILGDSLFAFLLALTTYVLVSAEASPHAWVAFLAGLLAGIAFWVRTVGLTEVVLVPLWLAFAAGRPRGPHLRRAGVAALAALAAVVFYIGMQAYFTGFWGLERQSGYNLYSRVATFANCRDFTPPKGTAFLCPQGPDLGPAGYQYGPTSPPVARYGTPDHAPPEANAVLRRFDIAVLENQPLQWGEHIADDFWNFYLNPRQAVDAGYTPATLLAGLEDPVEEGAVEPAIALKYPSSVGYLRRHVHALNRYAQVTRLEVRPVMLLLMLGPLIGLILLRGRLRAVTALFTLTALLSILFAIAGESYDARYAYPTLAPLGAATALGGWALARTATRRLRRRRSRNGPVRDRRTAGTPPET